MPSSTRPATPGPSDVLKRAMSDEESSPQHSKKARRNSSPEPTNSHDSNRDTKRRRRRKKKAPLVTSATKNQPTQSRPDNRSRAPLSARNEIIRFSSAPSEPDQPASAVPATKHPSQAPPPRETLRDLSLVVDDIVRQGMPSTPNDRDRSITTVEPRSAPSSSSLEDKVVQLEAELKSKNNLIASHQAFFNQVQQAVTCQVCLDLMYRPYALAPCGHLACHSCLVNWFTAPPPDNREAPPSIMRRKTCPHCRAVVRERPVEVWSVKSIARATGKSGLLLNLPVEDPESLNANADPWKDIFPKPGAPTHRRFPWFFPNADVDDDDARVADIAPRGEDLGMLDIEDGGIYRCLDCMHEIWDGVCTSCGRVYSGHRPQGDDEDDEADPVGWLEDQMGVEEADVADDPGWMGLEDGEADDGGDADDWRPFEPWRRRFHVFRGPWNFLGAIHFDGEDDDEEDDDDMHGAVDDSRVDEGEGSEDEGYESSFIDDGDGFPDLEDGPRIYEIRDDDEDEDYHVDQHSRPVDLASDGDEQEGSLDVHRQAASSNDEPDDDTPWHVRRRARFIESDGSDV